MKEKIDFKNKFYPAAVRAAAGTKIFPETILAAAALESGLGKSKLSSKYNNFFGVTKGKGWNGKVIIMATKEQRKDGTVYWRNAEFRYYNSPEESFKDYVKVVSKPIYVNAGVHTATTPQDQIKAIKKAGYATSIEYANVVISLMKEFAGIAVNTVKDNPGTVLSAALIVSLFFF